VTARVYQFMLDFIKISKLQLHYFYSLAHINETKYKTQSFVKKKL
jgi:hypothetical protein